MNEKNILILEQASMIRSVQAENQRLKETIEKLEKELILSMAKCFAIAMAKCFAIEKGKK